MAGPANVDDFEVFRQFRAALMKFAQASERAIAHADSEIGRTRSWLENEQGTLWQGQLRKRTQAVTSARDAVRQKKLYLDSTGRRPEAIEEEKILAKCLAAVEEAQRKIDAVKRALPKLEKEAGIYRGGVSRLMGDLSVEIPRAITLLDRLAGSLEAYVQIAAPSAGVPAGGDFATGGEVMSRGGDLAEHQPMIHENEPPAPEPPAPEADQAGAAAAPPGEKEQPHVPH